MNFIKNNKKLKSLSLSFKLNLKQLLLSNVHLGHTSRFLNSQVKPFLLGRRNDVFILNLVTTAYQLRLMLNLIINLTSKRLKILIIREQDFFNFAQLLQLKNVFYYNKKWIGGLLTNYKKVSLSKNFKDNNLRKNSLRSMRYMPSLVFFFDIDVSHWALKEAYNLELPVASIIDSNTVALNYVNYPIVGNNKSFEAIALYFYLIRNALLKGRQKELIKILKLI